MKSKRYHTSALHPTKRPSRLVESWDDDREDIEYISRRRRRDRKLWDDERPERKRRRAA